MVIALRVPVAEYEQVMSSLGELGLPTNLVEKASDVTAQVVDLDSRIKTMKEGVERVRALMADATKVSEVIAIESELSSREADLEALLAEQAALSDQVALSTVTVTVKAITDKPVAAPVLSPPPAARTGFLGGLDKGWAAAKAFAVWVAARGRCAAALAAADRRPPARPVVVPAAIDRRSTTGAARPGSPGRPAGGCGRLTA